MGFRYKSEKGCIHTASLTETTSVMLNRLLRDMMESTQCYIFEESDEIEKDKLKSLQYLSDIFILKDMLVSPYLLNSFLNITN